MEKGLIVTDQGFVQETPRSIIWREAYVASLSKGKLSGSCKEVADLAVTDYCKAFTDVD